MLDFISEQDMAIDPEYYVGRWAYHDAAIQLCRSIEGAGSWRAGDVLECGPYKLPIVRGSDTLDLFEWNGTKPTYLHDAGVVPWPIDKRYKLFIALQVWEHLEGQQRPAWCEVERIADWAVISVPYKWPHPKDHADIDESTLFDWTCREPVVKLSILSAAAPLTRLLCLYDLREP